jgi:Family of unknown function (DUF6272)
MSLSNIYGLYKSLEEQSILLSFKGVVTADLLTSILQIIETKLTEMEESPQMKKKVFNVLVECLQNLYHHVESENISDSRSESLAGEHRSALFLIAKFEDGFYVRTGNYVQKKFSEELEEKIKKINTLDKEELKLYYQKILSNGKRSTKGTAGLGMIDIARKSGNKLEYEFVDANKGFDFFCLNVRID